MAGAKINLTCYGFAVRRCRARNVFAPRPSENLARCVLGYRNDDRRGIGIGRLRQSRREIVTWVGSNIVPHEADLRARLRRMAVSEEEIGDQDAYVKISNLDSVAHIQNGRGYFFATAQTMLLDRIRRERIVRIDSMTEMEALTLADEDPGPERRVSARLELERVRRLIAALPDRCREIFELRRIQGVPQREIAERLGIPEHIVEAQAVRGLKLILKALAGEGAGDGRALNARRDKAGEQQRNG